MLFANPIFQSIAALQVLQSLLRSSSQIGYLLGILFLFMIIFSLLGLELFATEVNEDDRFGRRAEVPTNYRYLHVRRTRIVFQRVVSARWHALVMGLFWGGWCALSEMRDAGGALHETALKTLCMENGVSGRASCI